MKKFKNFTLGVLGAAILSLGLYACSGDDNAAQNVEQTSNIKTKSVNSGLSYAKAFYGKEVEIGKSVDLIDPETKEGITLSEIIVSGNTQATGYIANKLGSGEFLYFADVDRESDILTTYDSNTKKQEIFTNLDKVENYLTTDKFDFIKYADENIILGSGCSFWQRLWGTCIRYMPPSDLGNGRCGQQKNVAHYRFFQVVSSEGSNYIIDDCENMH